MIVGGVVLATASIAADDPKLAAEAKIKETEARATALGQVKDGTVRSEELEREHGHLIYSYDIEVPGKSGIDEVNVDAMTGKVIAKTHEGPKAERKEADAEAKKEDQAEAMTLTSSRNARRMRMQVAAGSDYAPTRWSFRGRFPGSA
jgi:hypothetical protein